ncbi:MAG: DUF983 domain-containing protein [Salibacteraceae bacterium]|nr:DUF983 domain-containing protein [Salibacteraceae bacterium]
MKKGNKLYSIFNQTCPHCHEGDLFVERNPYKLNKIFQMPHECDKCGQMYELEPSFFYGAMYVNYGITVAICVAVFVAMTVLGSGWELHDYVIGIIGALIVTAPYTFRLGRAIWINMFVSYDKHAIEKAQHKH